MMDYIEEARKLRPLIEKATQSLTDQEASMAVNLLPPLRGQDGTIPAGHRIQRDGKVLKAKIPMWDRPEYYPEAQPDLWEEIPYRGGYRIIPEVITVATAFSEGEIGWWKDKLYKSKYPGNVHNPDNAPGSWEEK